jgi:hypothetical protein
MGVINGSKSMSPIKLFYCYANEDEYWQRELEKHLRLLRRQGLIEDWHSRDISAGTEWTHEVEKHLNTAQIILLLISADYLASDYSYSIEMKRALERHENGEALVIPISLRPVDLEGAPFYKLRVLPTNNRAITKWTNRDEAFLNVAQDIRKAVNELNIKLAKIHETITLEELTAESLPQWLIRAIDEIYIEEKEEPN